MQFAIGLAGWLWLAILIGMPLASRLPVAHTTRFRIIGLLWFIGTIDVLVVMNLGEFADVSRIGAAILRALVTGANTALLLLSLWASFRISAYAARLPKAKEMVRTFWFTSTGGSFAIAGGILWLAALIIAVVARLQPK